MVFQGAGSFFAAVASMCCGVFLLRHFLPSSRLHSSDFSRLVIFFIAHSWERLSWSLYGVVALFLCSVFFSYSRSLFISN